MTNVVQFPAQAKSSWIKRTAKFFVIDFRKDAGVAGNLFFLAGLLLGLLTGGKSEENVIPSFVASLIASALWSVVLGYIGTMIDKIIRLVRRGISNLARKSAR